ncbi:phage portal protein [Anaerophilus nitritogenes]|uniref:phage portal protein n=1 Tax=Anaerophilus nitritogenes TaxID=2498136 RepID=UPI00101DD990|nr:phage portal protein [Anaerophilus nitritogenes]
MVRKKGKAQCIELIQKAEEKIPQGSRQLEDFSNLTDIKKPPYSPEKLLSIIDESPDLKQLINAMATNIALFGHGIKYKEDFDYDKADESKKKAADKEWEVLKRLYKYCNPTEDFKKVLEKMLIDRESIGWGTIEVLRNLSGEVVQFEYCRAVNIRIAQSNNKFVEMSQLQMNEEGEYEEVTMHRKFKKFVQLVNGKKVYFKEFGDPRSMDCESGEYGEDILPDNLATELIYFPIHSSYSDYGVPRWIGTLVSALGSRAAEVLNYMYFETGTILPAAIIVDGGQLTESSIDALREGKGINNAYKLLLLETAPFEEEDPTVVSENKNKVSTKIEKLADTNNKDGLFQEYQKNNKERIRDSFRLPPIYTGQSTDYTQSTADVARIIAEEQIFTPERDAIASMFNTVINNERGIGLVVMYLKGPQLSNMTELAKALEPFIQAGAVTPNMLIDKLGELLNKSIEPLPDEIGNLPFEIVKQKYMQKNDEGQIENTIEKIEKSELDYIEKLNEMLEVIKKIGADADE